MEIFIAFVSILVLTAATWVFNKVFNVFICPICAGVSLTWIWMLGASFLDIFVYSQFVTPIALLMGGSVVGIAYQYAELRRKSVTKLTWLTWLIAPGFVAVYGLLMQEWLVFGAGAVVWLGFAVYALFPRGKSGPKEENEDDEEASEDKRKKLEKELEECC